MRQSIQSIKTTITPNDMIRLDNLLQRGERRNALTLATETAEAATTQIEAVSNASIGCEICISTSMLFVQPSASYEENAIEIDNMLSGDYEVTEDIVIAGIYGGVEAVVGTEHTAFFVKVTNQDGGEYYAPLDSLKSVDIG